MPTEMAHRVAAFQNAKTIRHLSGDLESFPGWIATIAFYEAVHIVEAFFYRDGPQNGIRQHTTSHSQRNELLKTTNRYSQIYVNFRPLFNDSLLARYLETDPGGQFGSRLPNGLFAEYMSGSTVMSDHVRVKLGKILKSCRKLLGDPSFLDELEKTHWETGQTT